MKSMCVLEAIFKCKVKVKRWQDLNLGRLTPDLMEILVSRVVC